VEVQRFENQSFHHHQEIKVRNYEADRPRPQLVKAPRKLHALREILFVVLPVTNVQFLQNNFIRSILFLLYIGSIYTKLSGRLWSQMVDITVEICRRKIWCKCYQVTKKIKVIREFTKSHLLYFYNFLRCAIYLLTSMYWHLCSWRKSFSLRWNEYIHKLANPMITIGSNITSSRVSSFQEVSVLLVNNMTKSYA